MKLRDVKIGFRLLGGFGAVILIVVISALINNHSIITTKKAAIQVADHNFPSALLAEEMAYNAVEVQQYLTDVGATRDPAAFKEAEEAAAAFKAGIERFRQMYTSRNDTASLTRLQEIEKDFDSFYTQGKIMAQAYVSDGTAAGNRIMRDFDASSDRIAEDVRVFKAQQRDEATSTLKALTDSMARTQFMLWFLALGSVALALAISWIITRSITRPLDSAVKFAQSVARGDLSRKLEVSEGGELGELTTALNSMTQGLGRLVSSIKNSSAELTSVFHTIVDVSRQVMGATTVQAGGIDNTSSAIVEINSSIKSMTNGVESLANSAAESSSSTLEMAASVEEVALNVETLARSAEEVSASITQTAAAIRQIDGSAATLQEAYTRTAASVGQMDDAIRLVEHNAGTAATISAEVLKDAETGESSVKATMKGMKEIRRSSAITAEMVSTLSKRAEEIGAILSVIDEVAGQTNLLALNAAIIAAQAGEHGKGFAVVAEEIKALADRTSSSTREIGEVIRGVQSETQRAVEAIAEAEASIVEGEQLSQKSEAALAKIVTGMQRASQQVDEIARATVEQARESGNFRGAMEQVSEMVYQIARATGEQRKGSELIMAEVSTMRDLTSLLRNSTREQSKTGGFIAKTTADITAMIMQVKRSCEEQSRGSEQIVMAAEEIKGSTASTLEAVKVMDKAVAGMSGQLSLLEKEVQVFTVN